MDNTESIEQIRQKVLNNNLTTTEINNYLERVILLKFENIDDDKKYKKLSHIQEYLEYKINNKNQININLLSYINILFLPLGIIVGYFGMNFNSMGNPTLKKGIFKESNGLKLVIVLTIVSCIISYLVYNYHHI